MKTYNNVDLKNIIINNIGVGFEIKVTSVQGIKGVYAMFDDLIEIDGDYSNALLIQEL